MIRVTLDGCKLTVEGHAGYAPVGQDIVCSAASLLIYALYGGLKSLDGVEGLEYESDGGYASVRVTKLPPEGEGMLQMATIGYQMLANQYPKHVAFDSKR